MRKLFRRFVSLSEIDQAQSVTLVDFQNPSNQLAESNLMIGFSTKQVLRRLVDEVEPSQISRFFHGVRSFYTGSTHYLCSKFPLEDEVLKNAAFVDFERRKSCTFASVEYFLTRLRNTFRLADTVYDEFVMFQSLPDIPSEIDLQMSVEGDGSERIRPDDLWHGLSKLKDVNGKVKFGLLSEVAKLVLVLPHSNADEERIFSIIRKNKTPFRSNLSLKTTLPNILQCKVNMFSHTKCYEYQPSPKTLQNAKHATWDYNKKH